METKHVLTNKDISEQYRDIKLHLMIQDFFVMLLTIKKIGITISKPINN